MFVRAVGAFAHRGFTWTAFVLLVLGVVTATWAYHLRPDAALPQPGSSSISLTFAPHHSASAPMTVTLSLQQSLPAYGSRTVALGIDLSSPDFAQPGWALLAFVPSGVHVEGALSNDPHYGRVIPQADGGDAVYITPGPSANGTFSMTLIWNHLDNGPLQVRGANLVAAFPDFDVENETSANSSNAAAPALPPVTLTRELEPGINGDYSYLGGPPPDHQDRYTWYWDPAPSPAGATPAFPSMSVEAQSPTTEEKLHSAEFQSGILFGVAAAAVIAAVPEFISAGNRKPRQVSCPHRRSRFSPPRRRSSLSCPTNIDRARQRPPPR